MILNVSFAYEKVGELLSNLSAGFTNFAWDAFKSLTPQFIVSSTMEHVVNKIGECIFWHGLVKHQIRWVFIIIDFSLFLSYTLFKEDIM